MGGKHPPVVGAGVAPKGKHPPVVGAGVAKQRGP
jgi:hypothetical protein